MNLLRPPGVTGKLFLAILAACLLLALGIGMAFRISFQNGFLDYVRKSNETRVEIVADAMARLYAQHGDWNFVHEDPDNWLRLIRTLTPPADRDSELDGNGHRHRHMDRRGGGGDGPPPPPLPGLRTRLWLLDQQRQVIGGRGEPPQEDTFSRPIEVGGRTVGWVLSTSPARLTRMADLHFLDQQLRSSWIIVGLSVLLAAGAALWLARGFLAPLKRLTSATHQLAAGHFSARVPITRSDEFGRLGQDFNQLAHTLEKNENMRRQFMADVSHELRTPLSVLRGELEALEDGVRALTPDSLRSLQVEVATLTKLVDDLYQLSLSDVGALSYRKAGVDLAELLPLSLGAFRERLAGKSLTVSLAPCEPGRCRVFGDADRLNQLFNNLLENSVRYTDAGGRLEIACHADGDRVRIDIQDSAPGVPQASLATLFDRFSRMESSRNRASGGSGLGLAICQNIVEAHGGTLTARQSPLGGLWMEISLPRLRDKA